jgi:hypothetical protein
MPNEILTPIDQLIKNIGLPTENGILKSSRGKYYFVSGKTKQPVLPYTTPETELAKLVGKKVTAFLSGKSIVFLIPQTAASIKIPRRIICYKPVPDLNRKIDIEVERTIRNQFVNEGILSKAQAEILDKVESIGH